MHCCSFTYSVLLQTIQQSQAVTIYTELNSKVQSTQKLGTKDKMETHTRDRPTKTHTHTHTHSHSPNSGDSEVTFSQ